MDVKTSLAALVWWRRRGSRSSFGLGARRLTWICRLLKLRRYCPSSTCWSSMVTMAPTLASGMASVDAAEGSEKVFLSGIVGGGGSRVGKLLVREDILRLHRTPLRAGT